MTYYSNILLIAGSGRNVGKTITACRLIEYLAKRHSVNAVKISPHFHEYDADAETVFKNDFCIILKETKITQKDSSRMLQAGADQVMFLMCDREKLRESFAILASYLHPENPVVIESGGLYNIVEPAVFLFVKGGDKEKTTFRNESNLLILNSDEINQFNPGIIDFLDGTFILNNR